MEPLPKRPRSDFDGPGEQQQQQDGDGLQRDGGGGGDLECRRFNTLQPIDGRDAGQEGFSSAGKPKPCMKFFSTSGCPFGESCHFLHHVPGGLSSLGLAPVVSLSAASASASQKKATGPAGGPSVTVNGYKTKLCNRFNTGEGCRFGDRCHFAHGESDLRPPSNAPRGNNRRPTGTAPPGFGNGSSHFPNPAGYPAPSGNVSSFPSRGDTNQPGITGNNSAYPNPTGYPAPPGNVSSFPGQGYAEPNQHGVPTNAGSVTYPAGSVSENVPVY